MQFVRFLTVNCKDVKKNLKCSLFNELAQDIPNLLLSHMGFTETILVLQLFSILKCPLQFCVDYIWRVILS